MNARTYAVNVARSLIAANRWSLHDILGALEVAKGQSNFQQLENEVFDRTYAKVGQLSIEEVARIGSNGQAHGLGTNSMSLWSVFEGPYLSEYASARMIFRTVATIVLVLVMKSLLQEQVQELTQS